jgi:hypothetical protein
LINHIELSTFKASKLVAPPHSSLLIANVRGFSFAMIEYCGTWGGSSKEMLVVLLYAHCLVEDNEISISTTEYRPEGPDSTISSQAHICHSH